MGHIKKHGNLHFFHSVKAKHIDNEIVITKRAATLAQDDFIITGFKAFIDDMLHLMGCQKLCFFDINNRTGFCHRCYQVGLATQKCGQLDNIRHCCHRLSLVGLVYVSDNGHIEGFFDVA